MQEAYVKGVSSWNFDVAALKAEAAEADAEPMPTIPEAPREFRLDPREPVPSSATAHPTRGDYVICAAPWLLDSCICVLCILAIVSRWRAGRQVNPTCLISMCCCATA